MVAGACAAVLLVVALAGETGGLTAVFATALGSAEEGDLVNPLMVAEREAAALEEAQVNEDRWAAADRQWLEEIAEMDTATRERAALKLVPDLRDDRIYQNAKSAMRKLRLLGDDAIPALQQALATSDSQQRRYVVSLLIELGAPLTDRLLLAAFQNLEEDERSPYPEVPDDTAATRLMIESGPRAWDYAVSGLYSKDQQRRFLSALVLAHSRSPRATNLTVTILAGHLRDNEWQGDAGMASRALFQLGDLALPQLRRLRTMPGEQARRLVALVISELEDPSQSLKEAYQRALRLAPAGDGRPLVSWRFGTDRSFGLERRRGR
ncbi:MAG: hypothetical protein O2816_03780 [Planctomycetota bacterium]|nr:hypothetical protein [Planctomycetota bacterium]